MYAATDYDAVLSPLKLNGYINESSEAFKMCHNAEARRLCLDACISQPLVRASLRVSHGLVNLR